MSKQFKIRFREVTQYEAVLTIDYPLAHLGAVEIQETLEAECPGGEPLWFRVLESQAPDWATKTAVEVDERELVHCEQVDPNPDSED
jgi:hypothetical protein